MRDGERKHGEKHPAAPEGEADDARDREQPPRCMDAEPEDPRRQLREARDGEICSDQHRARDRDAQYRVTDNATSGMFVWVYGRASSAVAVEIILSDGQLIAEMHNRTNLWTS